MKVIIPLIRMNAMFEWNGYRMTIRGRTGDWIVFYPAIQALLPDPQYVYAKKLYKYDEDRKLRIFRSSEYYGINRSENVRLFDILLSKCNSPLFSKVFRLFRKNLKPIINNFYKSDEEVQAQVLNEMLHAFQCNSLSVNLKKVGGVAVTGRLAFNKMIPRNEGQVFIVNQSVSGLHENKMLISLTE